MIGIPSTETIWVTQTTKNNDVYYITSKQSRDFYYLYKVENNKAIKIGKDKDPLELEKKYIKEKTNE